MKSLFKLALIALVALVPFAGADEPNAPPPPRVLVDAVSVNAASKVGTNAADNTLYTVSVKVDYTALGNRSISVQVWDENLDQWKFMGPVEGGTINGSAIDVATGQGTAVFYYSFTKNSGWGQFTAAYGDGYPVQIGVAMYSGNTLKASADGSVYGK